MRTGTRKGILKRTRQVNNVVERIRNRTAPEITEVQGEVTGNGDPAQGTDTSREAGRQASKLHLKKAKSADHDRDRGRTGGLGEARVTDPESTRGEDEDLATEDTGKPKIDESTEMGVMSQANGKVRKERKSGGKVAEMVKKIEALGTKRGEGPSG